MATLRATSHAAAFVAQQHQGSSIADAAVALDEVLRQQASMRETLDSLANSQDPLGYAMAKALCTGMESLASQPNAPPAPQDEWRSFLIEELQILAPNSPPVYIQARVNGFLTTANLAVVNPRLAQIYYQECLRPIG